MKIVGVMGSPRKGGRTDILLDVALEEARTNGASVTKISVAPKKIQPCNGCLKCTSNGTCVIKDDMEEIYEELLAAEGIIWATPVYFWSMTGQTKVVMDRTYALTHPKLRLASKVGGVILVAGNRGCVNTANLFHMYFTYNHMFFAEFAQAYSSQWGETKKNDFAVQTTREMVRQMIALIGANLIFPQEFDAPLNRFVTKKYGL